MMEKSKWLKLIGNKPMASDEEKDAKELKRSRKRLKKLKKMRKHLMG